MSKGGRLWELICAEDLMLIRVLVEEVNNIFKIWEEGIKQINLKVNIKRKVNSTVAKIEAKWEI